MPEENPFGQRVGDVVPGWQPRPRPAQISLLGRHVAVVPLRLAHAPALHDALCGPDDLPLWTYRPVDPPPDVAAMASYVEAHLAAAPSMLTWALVPAGGEPAGLASFMRIEPSSGQVEVAGVLLARSLQRTPAATEAIHLLMAYAFEGLGYRRFEWKCDSLNEPSRRAAARLGFVAEGRFRHHLVTKGRNRDTDWFSVTAQEWPAVRDAHRAWLAPGNFDDDGRQRSSLSALTATLPGVGL